MSLLERAKEWMNDDETNYLKELSESNDIPYNILVEFFVSTSCDRLDIENIDDGTWSCKAIYDFYNSRERKRKIHYREYLMFRDYEYMKTYVMKYTKSFFSDNSNMIIDSIKNMDWFRRRVENVLDDDWLDNIATKVIESGNERIYDDRFHQMDNGWIRCCNNGDLIPYKDHKFNRNVNK